MRPIPSAAVVAVHFVSVYVQTPLAVMTIVRWLPVPLSDTMKTVMVVGAVIAVYNVFRRRLGRMPWI